MPQSIVNGLGHKTKQITQTTIGVKLTSNRDTDTLLHCLSHFTMKKPEQYQTTHEPLREITI